MKKLLIALLVLSASIPLMGQITVPNTFSPGTTISSAQMNANFDALETAALNRTGGTMTGTLTARNILPDGDNTRDLGSSGASWKDLYVDGTATLAAASITTLTTSFTNTGLKVLDTNASHVLSLVPGSNITANRVLTLTTGDSDRTITLSGNPTLADWFDQSVKVAATPTFGSVTVSCVAYDATAWNGSGLAPCADAVRDKIEAIVAAAGQAPSDAQYWTGAANGTLSAEKNLGALGTGLVINTSGTPSIYTGALCSGSYITALNDSGVPTCSGLPLTLTPASVGFTIAGGTTSKTLTVDLDATVRGTNTGDVSLAGSGTYITISGQTITRGQVDLSDSNHVTGNLPVGNLGGGVGANSSTYWRGDGSWNTPFNDPIFLALRDEVQILRAEVASLRQQLGGQR